MFYHLFCINRKETINTLKKKPNAFLRLAFSSLMFLKQLLNNLQIFLEGFVNCIYTHVSIKVNVLIQKNAYYIHNYVHKYMENCLFREKCSCSS